MRRHFMAALFANANLFEIILSQSNAIVDNTLLESDRNLNQNQDRLSEFHSQPTDQDYTAETVRECSGIEANSNEAFIKFLKALVTTLIAIILSHLWYIDQRDDDSRQQRILKHNFYEYTRSNSRLHSEKCLTKSISEAGTSSTRQIYRPNKSKNSSKKGRSSKYSKRSLAYRQNNLECITESEDEAIAELNYLEAHSSSQANSIVASTTSLSVVSLPSSGDENEDQKLQTKISVDEPETGKTDPKNLSAEAELVNYVSIKYSDYKIENNEKEENYSNSFNFSLFPSTSVEEVEIASDAQFDILSPESDPASPNDMSRNLPYSDVSNKNISEPLSNDCYTLQTNDSPTSLIVFNENLELLTEDINHNSSNIQADVTSSNLVIDEIGELGSKTENTGNLNCVKLISGVNSEAGGPSYGPPPRSFNELIEAHSEQNFFNPVAIEQGNSADKNFEQPPIPLIPHKIIENEPQAFTNLAEFDNELTSNQFEPDPENANDVIKCQLTIDTKIETQIGTQTKAVTEIGTPNLTELTSDQPLTSELDSVNFHTELFENVLSELESDDFRELISMLAADENEVQNENNDIHPIETSHLQFQDPSYTNSKLATQPMMSPSPNSTPTNTLTSCYKTHGSYPTPYQQKTQSSFSQTLLDNGHAHLSRSPVVNNVRVELQTNFKPPHINGNQQHYPLQSARNLECKDNKQNPEFKPEEEKRIVISNELTETDKRRTSIAEAYPYIKDNSNSSKVVIGITRDESFLRHKQVTDKVLTDLQELQQEFEENRKNFSSHRLSFDSEEKAGTSFSFEGNLDASCISSNDRIIFEGLSKHDMKTHKDISFRRKTQESMSSDDNYSVSTREMLDDITDVVVMIRCRYKPCGKIRELKIARTCYKMCHNCFTYYCSKSCRENHWERHKIKCVYSRVNSTCKNILSSIRHAPATLAKLCEFAEAQYNIFGRGAVLLKFTTHADADNFVRGHDLMPDLKYITGSKLEEPELCQLYFADVGSHLNQIISSYDPLSKIVVIIAVDLSAYKESNQKVIPRITSRFMCKYLAFRILKDLNTVRESDNFGASRERPKALVATSMVKQNSFNTQKDRKLFFSNLQRNLKNKGVNIRIDFPFVYQQICNYVETGEHFEPITLYPHDPATGQQFMCLIMPDSQPNFLSWVSEGP